MKIKDIIYHIEVIKTEGDTERDILHISFDSRDISDNSLFVAVKGTKTDGHAYIQEVIKAGAKAIICEEMPSLIEDGVTYIKVKDSSYSLGIIASNFYGRPSSFLKLVGVTGTNGKTTTVTLLYNLFDCLGYKAGLISTVRNIVNGDIMPATHTTPDAIQLNKLLKMMVDKGCTYCFMEVSSHAVVQHRISGLEFSGGVFSNLTHDHLDFHITFDEYLKAKKTFFDLLPETAFALSNADDKNGAVMLQNTKASKYFYSLHKIADFRCKVLENHFSGLLLQIDNTELWSRLTGRFNAYNLMAVYAASVLLGEKKDEILTCLSNLKGAEGRFECVRSHKEITGIVDYAHTPDALKNVLETIEEISGGQGKLITVVGAGGDRDKTKRPLMAKIVCEKSNYVILTSDNPRSEDPVQIIKDMQEGVEIVHRSKVLVITDRKEAIKAACTIAKTGDIILVAGKGHEKYQESKGVKVPFDDVKILEECLNN